MPTLNAHYQDHEFELDLEWVDPDSDAVREACMEEWEDHSSDPQPTEEAWFDYVTYSSSDELVRYFINEQGEVDFLELEDWVTFDGLVEGAKLAWLKNMHGPESGVREAADAYYGSFGTPRDFARFYTESDCVLDSLPDIIRDNIDWDGVATDLLADGFWEIDDYYFRNN